jgi:hypothetical protein
VGIFVAMAFNVVLEMLTVHRFKYFEINKKDRHKTFCNNIMTVLLNV